ncbi:MAG: bifunctional 5,10-methylenetetrahydrofolate dehydrogenase/5,10-methenyltetrahydrofolate cyclohydrolase [Patescibacteria group bacterium]
MERINGEALAASIRGDVKRTLLDLGLRPRFGVLLVGDDAASHLYVNRKEKACAEVGIATDIRRMPASTSDEDLLAIINTWNADEEVDAILIQVPLPPGHDTDKLIAAMDPRKDADGFHPTNTAALLAGHGTVFPPVHVGILRLIGATPRDMRNAKATIIANSDTFSAPLEHLLATAGCFVTVYSPDEIDPPAIKDADIIVVAVGRGQFLTRDLVKSGTVIIDVGTNRTKDGKLVGDADEKNLVDVPGWISPVPGGVGPMTIAMLLSNIAQLAKMRRGL